MTGLLELPQAAQEEIRRALGLEELHNHAGITGMAYLRKVDAKNYHRYFALPEDINWPMIRSVSVVGHHEFRQPSAADLEQGWLYCYDRNSSHAYAASQIKAGVGQPRIFKGIEFDHLIPGFWACEIEGYENVWNAQGVMQLFPVHQGWLSTPLLKMAQYQGCKIRVEEAYIWPDKKDRGPVFARWATKLWGLRQQYEQGSSERQAVKDIMNKSVGLLRRKNGEGHKDYRPDWYSLILAEERAVVWYKAFQVWQSTGLLPIGCYADALYYCVNGPIAPLETLKNGQPAKGSLGGYKVDYRLPLVEEVKNILLIPKLHASKRIELLKAWGREHGYI